MDQGVTYQMVELVGTSPESVEQAIQNGIADAVQSGRKLDWFEVREVRGFIEQNQVGYYQVRMAVGYRAE